MQYIRRHWLGRCSLAWAFWMNFVALNIVVTVALVVPIVLDSGGGRLYEGRIQTSMGDDVRYLDSSTHSEAKTADVCLAYSRFFQDILA